MSNVDKTIYYNYYNWLYGSMPIFFENLEINVTDNFLHEIIIKHGESGHKYANYFNQHNIPFEHGLAMIMLTTFPPYSQYVLEEAPNAEPMLIQWMARDYPRLKLKLPRVGYPSYSQIHNPTKRVQLLFQGEKPMKHDQTYHVKWTEDEGLPYANTGIPLVWMKDKIGILQKLDEGRIQSVRVISQMEVSLRS